MVKGRGGRMKIALFGLFSLKLLMQVQTKLFLVVFLSLSLLPPPRFPPSQIRELHVVLRWMTEKEDGHHKKEACLPMAPKLVRTPRPMLRFKH